MGNSATKEQRPSTSRLGTTDQRRASSPSTPTAANFRSTESSTHPLYSFRTGRGSRSDLSSTLGIGSTAERDSAGLESRRETKQEREARRMQRERANREKERERSMREESVDGGFLVTQGVYTGIEDYNKTIVRQLMIERRIAPFWKGLNEHSDAWTENQLLAAARGRPIPAPDEIPSEDQYGVQVEKDIQNSDSKRNINNLTVPISSRSQSFNSDSSSNLSPGNPTLGISAPNFPAPVPSSGVALFRGRAKTLASLTTSSKAPHSEMMPREMKLPKDPFINGQPIEAYLYKDAAECPICFLYYPPYLNKTRCCDQAICSECFVQIKRPDPHVPEHGDSTAAPVAGVPNIESDDGDGENTLVSEPASCPFCVQPEFGVTYDPPSFRRGLTYVNQASGHPLANPTEAMSSSSSLASAMSGGAQISQTGFARRRTTSISATSPTVISTDRIRPDWHQKLASARATAARRSAAATALHTAAYLMGNPSSDSDNRGFSGFGRRNIRRRATGNEGSLGASPSHLNMLALMSERYVASSAGRRDVEILGESGPGMLQPPHRPARRSRMDDLEDMMMMEAIRLSLASEEDRRKREEKEAKKEAKKKEKESRKAEKSARKAGVYQTSAHPSSTAFDNTMHDSHSPHGSVSSDLGKLREIHQKDAGPSSARSSNVDLLIPVSNSSALADSSVEAAQDHVGRSRAQLQPNDAIASALYHTNAYKPSHLRTLSNASSAVSSIDDHGAGSLGQDLHGSNSSYEASPNSSGANIVLRGSTQDTLLSSTPPGGRAGMEPMLNFRSLAAMVGEDEKAGDEVHMTGACHSADDSTEGGENPSSLDGGNASVDPSSVHSAEKANLAGDEREAIAGLKITAATRVSPDVDQGHQKSGLKTAETTVVMSGLMINGIHSV